jgi:hypothetical protein
MKSTAFSHLFRSSSLFKASLILNLMLGGLAFGLWQRSNHAQMKTELLVAQKPSIEKKPTPLIAKTQPFQWSQLDAPDFDTFVKNLRGIGCPEATIHDIVAGELTEIYAEKRQQATLAKLSAGNQHAQAEQRRLDTEQAQLLARLVPAPIRTSDDFGHEKSSSPSKPSKASGATLTANNPTSGIPVAFLVGNAPDAVTEPGTLPMTVTDPTLDPRTAEQLNQMRTQFAETLQKEAGQDPASPVYRQRWHKIQRDQEEFFSSMYGGDAFVRLQLEAMNKVNAAGK